MFVTDLLASRPGSAKHKIVALGSSSVQKGAAFVEKVWANAPEQSRPTVYPDYQGVYENEEVDIVYIGTPHSLHKRNCLDAIAAAKHVLCEKPFTINEKEAEEVASAAKAKGVFIMEGMSWRHYVFEPFRTSIKSNTDDLISCMDKVFPLVRRVT